MSNPQGGRPAIGEPINTRFGPADLAWLSREAARQDTTRAQVLRNVVTAAREAARAPVRTLPQHAVFMVDALKEYSPQLAERFADASALWLAHTTTGNEYTVQARDAEEAAGFDRWPAGTKARIAALHGAASASFAAAAEQEQTIASIVAGIQQDAREAGVDVDALYED